MLDRQDFEVEETGIGGGTCDCCGSTTVRVWGFVHRKEKTISAYFVTWAKGNPHHGARFDLVLGPWGSSATETDRYVVALDFRLLENGPEFIVADAQVRSASMAALATTALQRSDVIGTPLAPHVFAVVDAVYMSAGVEEVRSWGDARATR